MTIRVLDLAALPDWIQAALIVGAVFGILHTIAAILRNETRVHDLRVEIAELRLKYTRELMLRHGIDPDRPQAVPTDADEDEPIVVMPADEGETSASEDARRAA